MEKERDDGNDCDERNNTGREHKGTKTLTKSLERKEKSAGREMRRERDGGSDSGRETKL